MQKMQIVYDHIVKQEEEKFRIPILLYEIMLRKAKVLRPKSF